MMSNHRWWRKVPSATATAGCNRYAVQCRKCAFPIGTADQGVSGNRELASAIPAGQPPRPARRGPGGYPGQVSGTRLPGQAGDARAAAAHRPAGERADLQAGRPGGVILGPDLVDRLRHRGDAAGPGAGGVGGRRPGTAAGRRDRAAAADPGGVLPPGDPRVPPRGRRLYGEPRQPRPRVRLDLRGRAADRLRADRGGQRLGGYGRAGVGDRADRQLADRAVGGVHRAADVGQPARHPRGRQDLRGSHLPVHPQPRRSGGLRDLARGLRARRPDQLRPRRLGRARRSRGRRGDGGQPVPDPARLLGGDHRAHRSGGDRRRRAGVPEARSAQRTLLVMALIMAFLFLGITFLARQLEVQPYESGNPTLVAQIARYVLGPGIGRTIFLFVQIATLAILVLAANTAFNGFPVLAYFAADDALLPRQLRKRGHRLVYSNGILLLAGAAIFLVIGFRANVHRLIPLYAIGVVTSFTLAQAGMTRLHLRQREEGWRQGLLINGVGALITFIVLCVIIITKFVAGAWMVVVAVPLIVLLLSRTRSAYAAELAELKVEASQRLAPPKPRHEVVVLLEDLDRAAIGALQYARQLNPLHITAIHVALDPDHARRLAGLWARINLPVPLEVVDCPDRNLLGCAYQTVAELVRPDTEVTVLVPKRGFAKFWHRVLHDRSSTGLFKVLGSIDGVNVVIVPFRLGRRPILRSVPTDGYPTAPRA